jgi:serine/arginine repetitive matrix protein 2
MNGQGKQKRDELDADEGNADAADSGYLASVSQQSIRSTTVPGSPSSSTRSTKRYSNNLFGSGRFRDYSYIRGMTNRGSKGTTSSVSVDSSSGVREGSASYPDNLRPIPPDTGATRSIQSTPEQLPLARSAPLLSPPPPYENQSSPTFAAEYRLSKTLGPAGFKRASLAFEEVIKEMALIEEEADDEIVMPRTAPAQRFMFRQEQRQQTGETVCEI